jgi:hypothetical protein
MILLLSPILESWEKEARYKEPNTSGPLIFKADENVLEV